MDIGIRVSLTKPLGNNCAVRSHNMHIKCQSLPEFGSLGTLAPFNAPEVGTMKAGRTTMENEGKPIEEKEL